MKTAIRKTAWNTYGMSGYTHDVANDQRSAGGVHLHQVKKGAASWQVRICQTNGRYASFGPVSPVDGADGEAYFETAKNY